MYDPKNEKHLSEGAKIVIAKYLDKVEGRPLPTTENFYRIFIHDTYFINIRYDELAENACILVDGKRQYWTDNEDADMRMYVERYYGIRNKDKMKDAFRKFLQVRRFNPLQERIKTIVWDGKPHVKDFFIRWLKAPPTAYTREATRICFAQAILRAFQPGSKADNVIVLQGKQGIGKSSVIEWMAMEDNWYESLNVITGKEGAELLRGRFICELEELCAVVGLGSNAEGLIKRFISVKSDNFRVPYDVHASDHPRTCVFVGTTNRDNFLTDPTGNRRWYPIECRLKSEDFIYAHQDEIKADIEQAYAEMYHAFVNNLPLASPVLSKAVRKAAKEVQTAATTEDIRELYIRGYLEEQLENGITSTCILDVWENCLKKNRAVNTSKTASEGQEIGQILRKIGCISHKNSEYFPPFGTQRVYDIPISLLKHSKNTSEKARNKLTTPP